MIEKILLVMMHLSFLFMQSCQTYHQVDVKPVEVKPIHITIDVNVKVDRALDDIIDDVYKYRKSETSETPISSPDTEKD
ncbi:MULTISPECIES: YnbE-like lipoprotein [Desulfococcus]|jgi:hypothetical protein|uniref:YnbE-like lipoprotein n=1 Tax=Desulfococcus multivorans DSM 2059 TaxID=1121405 RepID=S7TYJ6_DESML|nr:YnbE-like lipoprotein [Desulfococcus multivorans]AOY57070.1 uncharacterized protein Dmul_02950 [Desulfococcus multivorans]AQU99582.1 hypothetical protein B2D07_01465 [Desulfococcus multivorans]EPR41780.1 YnbE-like lipoprotein [Desulfococcus multivorans DSM 2059]SJZ88287.1 hypothetical protein SAMN02745446_01953 [Desulfococcus multivorans DSM 2059]